MNPYDDNYWLHLPENYKNNLHYLRSVRDRVALEVQDDLAYHISDQKAAELVEDIASYRNMSSIGKIKTYYRDPESYSVETQSIKNLQLLKLVVLRIAKLEREICHVPIYDLELKAA